MSQFVPKQGVHYDDACASLYFPVAPKEGESRIQLKNKVVIKDPKFRLRLSPAGENRKSDLIIIFVEGYNQYGVMDSQIIYPVRVATAEDIERFFIKEVDEAGNVKYTPRYVVDDVYFRVFYANKNGEVKEDADNWRYTYVGFDGRCADKTSGEMSEIAERLRPTGDINKYQGEEKTDAEA